MSQYEGNQRRVVPCALFQPWAFLQAGIEAIGLAGSRLASPVAFNLFERMAWPARPMARSPC